MTTPVPVTPKTSDGLALFKLLQHIGGLKSDTHGLMKLVPGATEKQEEFTTILKKLIAGTGNNSKAKMAFGNISGEVIEDAETMMAALNGNGEKSDLSRQVAILSAMLDGKGGDRGDSNTGLDNGVKELISRVFDGKNIKGKDTEKSYAETRHTPRPSLAELATIARCSNDVGNEISSGTTARKNQMHTRNRARHVAGADKAAQVLNTSEVGENPTGHTRTFEAVPAEASSRNSMPVRGRIPNLTAAGNNTSEHGPLDDATQLQASSGTSDKTRGTIRNRQVPVSSTSQDSSTSIRDDGVRNVMETAIPPVREKGDSPHRGPKFTYTDMSEIRTEDDLRQSGHEEGLKAAALPKNMSGRAGDRSFVNAQVFTQYEEAAGDEHSVYPFKSEEAAFHRFAEPAKTARAITRAEGTVPTFHTQASSAVGGTHEASAATSIRSEALFDQVVQGARQQVLKGGGRMKITLNPPHLGSLHVDVVVEENKVHVMLRAATADVKHLLQANTEQLKASLGTQGLVADTISVSVHDRSGDQSHGYGYNGALGDEHRNNREQRNNHRDHDDPAQHAVTAESHHTRTDGTISLFA